MDGERGNPLMPDKLTPEEYEILANSPTDSPNLIEGDGERGDDAPDGVVEGQEDGA